MQDEGSRTLQYDPYNDGLAIEITLDRPATEADVAAARALLGDWLAAYGDQGLGYRNCGVEAEVGTTRFALWADRIRHADGGEAAVDAARNAAAQVRRTLPALSAQVTSAAEAADRDMDARLGHAPFHVRPGGDLLADVRAAEAPWYNGGLRPSLTAVVLMFVLRYVAREWETEVPLVVPNLLTACAVAGLTWASRLNLKRFQVVVGCCASSVLLAHGLVGVFLPGSALAISALFLVGAAAQFAWVATWLWRRR